MQHRTPHHDLPTHSVTNQPPAFQDVDLAELDLPLREAVDREVRLQHADLSGPDADADAARVWTDVSGFGRLLGQADVLQAGRDANDNPPVLHTHDATGHRIDHVRFHPGWHTMYAHGRAAGVHSVAWESHQPVGGHVHHAAAEYLLSQVESGVCCPLTMTYAAVPVLREHLPDLANTLLPKLLSRSYDGREIPVSDKTSAAIGMAMTEKQGGSDVRANSTRATPDDPNKTGSGTVHRLTGHKWFCSAPQSDAFLTLAQSDAGLTCFYVPRWTPDGDRNVFNLVRLKDKLGNRSNASSEVEYDKTWALQVGEAGRGVRTIVDMVHHTRLDCTVSAAALMRTSVVYAVHHAQHRSAFGQRLIDQPLMRNVLADLALESEAATALSFRVARAYDEAHLSPTHAALARILVAVGKYWLNKRVIGVVSEAMECHGGNGYIEAGPMARLYREAPLNGIWEGSGNVICLDVLRALARTPAAGPALLAEIDKGAGFDPRVDMAIATCHDELSNPAGAPFRARRVVEALALALQASLLVTQGDPDVSDLFCASRLTGGGGYAYGTLPPKSPVDHVLSRVLPAAGVQGGWT